MNDQIRIKSKSKNISLYNHILTLERPGWIFFIQHMFGSMQLFLEWTVFADFLNLPIQNVLFSLFEENKLFERFVLIIWYDQNRKAEWIKFIHACFYIITNLYFWNLESK